jgi:carboxyl-terminal processing protease
MNKKLIIIFTILAIIHVFFIDSSSLKISATTEELYEDLKVYSDVLTIIQKNYVDEIELKKTIYNSIKGMVSKLDPHSSFMPPDMYKEMQVETKGKFGGLGIEITIKDGVLTVVSPIEDTPAYRAGIKTGDQIIKIENEPTKDISLMDAVKKMRGKPKTEIKITIMRDEFKEPKEFSIIRDIIKIKSVKSKLIEDKYGYVRIAQFQENTLNEFRRALKDLKSSKHPIRGLILDLRGNPGGLLDQAVKICDEFLDSGLIVYTEGRIQTQKMQFHAKENKETINYPTVVLVNGGSASASEIVAGALKENGRAYIIGTQTFGKGTVQTIYPLIDGSGLRITTAKYYTPSHRSIQEKGIIPNRIVEDSIDSSYTSRGKIKFLREKDLLDHFKKEDVKEEDKEKEKDEEASSKNEEDKSVDPPLQAAIIYLEGKSGILE